VTSVSSANAYLSVATGNDSRITGALAAATAFSGDVSGVYSATSVDKIKGTGVTITALGTGNFLRYNGTDWANANLSSGYVTTGLGYTPINKAGDKENATMKARLFKIEKMLKLR
jgi:hypothetical protein